MSIYENLLFLHGHLADPRLAAPAREPAPSPPAPAPGTRGRARAPLVQPRRRVRGPAPLRGLGELG